MKFIRVVDAKSDPSAALFNQAWEIYEYSFPACERRTLEDQLLRLSDDRCHFEVAVDADGGVVGILAYWTLCDSDGEDYIYFEHLATAATQRNKGFGKVAVDYVKSYGLPVLLEIDPPQDELSLRRQRFYERMGFVLTEHLHIQQPYRKGEGCVDLRIMSYPNLCSRDRYESFAAFQISVLPQFEK